MGSLRAEVAKNKRVARLAGPNRFAGAPMLPDVPGFLFRSFPLLSSRAAKEGVGGRCMHGWSWGSHRANEKLILEKRLSAAGEIHDPILLFWISEKKIPDPIKLL